jgi:predicted Zn-dependent protease with MMP-like domain
MGGGGGLDADAMDLDEFAELASEALAEMPAWVQRAMTGVAMLVDDQPPPGWQGGGLLLGRFQGVPRTKRGSRAPFSLPDRIELYRIPILQVCRTREEVAARVRKVLGHEIGHAFGLSEARLRELGWH